VNKTADVEGEVGLTVSGITRHIKTVRKSTTIETITETLLKSVVIGGEVCRAERSRAVVGFKPFESALTPLAGLASGVVTSADLAVQETILGFLIEQGFQDCAIQAEEDTPSLQYFNADRTGATIYVDPIDGTLAYSMECPGWEEAALSAGFNQEILVYSRERIDRQLYGMVLGAFIPGSGIAAVCVLPELRITYHALHGTAFRNGAKIRMPSMPRTCRVAIGRRLLDPSGTASTPFAEAGFSVRWFKSSSPGLLSHLFEGTCTSYAGVHCGFDIQLASVVACAAGFVASDRNGNNLALNLSGYVDSIVLASSDDERARICEVMRRFPG
jgi:hypothetical protein